MKLVEERQSHIFECDKKILDLEKDEQILRKNDSKSFYFWSGFGIAASYLFTGHFSPILAGQI